MFRAIFVLFILSISLYGLYGVFSGAEKKIALRNDFDIYLSQAIERNSRGSETVIFIWNDFIDDEPDSPQSEGNNTQINSENMYALNSNILGGEKATNQDTHGGTGNFGTPRIKKITRDAPVNCNGGLIYDPCLVVGDPIPASGDMYFGSDRG